MTAIAQHSSATNEHPTPAIVVEPARRLLGAFDLDPATTPEFNVRIGAAKIFTQADDGLAQPWSGRVWLNPPGGVLRRSGDRWIAVPPRSGPGESSMLIWWDRLSTLWREGEIVSGFFVGFTLEILRTSQRGIPVQSFPRCYPKDRLAFKGDQPTHANVLVYLPPKDEHPALSLTKLRREFDSLGFCESGMK